MFSTPFFLEIFGEGSGGGVGGLACVILVVVWLGRRSYLGLFKKYFLKFSLFK